MPYDPNKHRRRSIRLKGYDYSQAGAYFVTMCAQRRELLFVSDDVIDMLQRWWDKLPEKFPSVETDAFVIMPNHAHGIIVVTGEPVCSLQSVGVNPRVDPAPGQTHGSAPTSGIAPTTAPTTDTVGVDPRVNPGQTHGSAPTSGPAPTTGPAPKSTPTLGEVIQWFKTLTTNEYIRGVKTLNWPPFAGRLWQRNYYEHIIRSEIELNAIRKYIVDNPARWEQDRDNPIHLRPAAETVAAYLSEVGL
jgi:putative transposase